MMNDEQRELFRNAILLQLEAAAPTSLPLATLKQGVILAGHRGSDQALNKELLYLDDKGLLKRTDKKISRSVHRYLITADGRDYLEELGLA